MRSMNGYSNQEVFTWFNLDTERTKVFVPDLTRRNRSGHQESEITHSVGEFSEQFYV